MTRSWATTRRRPATSFGQLLGAVAPVVPEANRVGIAPNAGAPSTALPRRRPGKPLSASRIAVPTRVSRAMRLGIPTVPFHPSRMTARPMVPLLQAGHTRPEPRPPSGQRCHLASATRCASTVPLLTLPGGLMMSRRTLSEPGHRAYPPVKSPERTQGSIGPGDANGGLGRRGCTVASVDANGT